jgi:DNA (cytosine-5)-methyltransferase 1
VVATSLVRTDFQSALRGCGVHDQRDPIRAIDSAGGFGLVSAFLVPRYGERPGQDPRCRSIDGALSLAVCRMATAAPARPRGVATSAASSARTSPAGTSLIRRPRPAGGGKGGGHTQVVSAFMAQGNGDRVGRPVGEPVTTLTERSTQQQLVAASLQSYYRTGVGSDCGEPMRAVSTEDRHALIAACLEQANTGMVGHSVRRPFSTIVEKGCTQRLIEARLELEGGPIGRRAKVLAFLWSHAGPPTPAEWADPTGTLQARLKFGLVILQGPDGPQVWMIVDIGLRMLKARELAGAMGLPRDVDLRDRRRRPADHHDRPGQR